jgi:hypothetical protein
MKRAEGFVGAGDLRVESDGVFFFCCIKPSVSIRYAEETLMTTALPALETQRSEIQRKIGQLGDMRSGSITTTGGRCGNPGCHCRKEGDPGHGPFYRLTRKIEGKTVTETFATPVALRKAQQEVAEFHRFRELSQNLVEVNEKICRVRPVEDTLTPQEKKRRKSSVSKSSGK